MAYRTELQRSNIIIDVRINVSEKRDGFILQLRTKKVRKILLDFYTVYSYECANIVAFSFKDRPVNKHKDRVKKKEIL